MIMATNDLLCKHDMTPPCAESSYSKCPHCSLDLCLEHINEHQHAVRIQFHEMTDRINEQKAESNNHSIIDEMKVKALVELDKWKEAEIEAVLTAYDEEKFHVEHVYKQHIYEKLKIQGDMFDELNTMSNIVEKKKNVHPHDIIQIEQKLNKLKIFIKKIEETADGQLTTIVTNIKVPETIELEHRLNDEAEEKIRTMVQEHQKTTNASKNELQRLQQAIDVKDGTIAQLRSRMQQAIDEKGRAFGIIQPRKKNNFN